uniref:Uncharacterized protein n=1 Tax=Globodera pallida TaxID=36090 RepID=A0A183CH38_GLOPA
MRDINGGNDDGNAEQNTTSNTQTGLAIKAQPYHQAQSSSTAPYDSSGLIQGSGYEGFSAEDMRDINGGNDDGNAEQNTTSNTQTGLSSIPEDTNDNDFQTPPQTPPTTFHDNQGGSIEAEEEDVQRALWESLQVQDADNAALELVKQQSLVEYIRKLKLTNGNAQ